MKNYYQVLNVTKISNLEDLLREYKRLYRTLEKEPDKKILNEAFDVLSNTESKNIYDSLLGCVHLIIYLIDIIKEAKAKNPKKEEAF